MSRLQSAIYRYWRIGMMFAYSLLAPCLYGQCTYVTLTVAGVLVLVGIVFRRRWAFLLTLGGLGLAVTFSYARLGPLPAVQPFLGPCGFDMCVP